LTDIQKWNPPVLTTRPAVEVVADGKKAINIASTDFLAISGNQKIFKACEAALRKYGCGSCGPRGFYGTIGTSSPPRTHGYIAVTLSSLIVASALLIIAMTLMKITDLQVRSVD
jgi:hypothetical protein